MLSTAQAKKREGDTDEGSFLPEQTFCPTVKECNHPVSLHKLPINAHSVSGCQVAWQKCRNSP